MLMQLSSLRLSATMPSTKKISILLLCVALTARTTLSAPTEDENIPVEDPNDTVEPQQPQQPEEPSSLSDPFTPRPLPTLFKNEPSCLRQGGLCIKKDECPQGQLSTTTGLCPEQAHLGVECCHGLSVKERRCSARGGECRLRSKCGRQLWEERAEDCGASEACCILTRLL